MLTPFVIAYCFALLLSWRLVGVVVVNTDEKHRQDAIRLCGYIWGGSSLGGGLISAGLQLQQSGVFAQMLQ